MASFQRGIAPGEAVSMADVEQRAYGPASDAEGTPDVRHPLPA